MPLPPPEVVRLVEDLTAATDALVRAIEAHSPSIEEILTRRENAILGVLRHLTQLPTQEREKVWQASQRGSEAHAAFCGQRSELIRSLLDNQDRLRQLRHLTTVDGMGDIMTLDA